MNEEEVSVASEPKQETELPQQAESPADGAMAPAGMAPEQSPPDADADSEPASASATSGEDSPGSDAFPATEDASASNETSADSGYVVKLPEFEGPLDLLLHLVRKHELDILNIPIAFVTEKYTAYIHMMNELNIDVASEYLVMAATLVHIKSRSLLPNPPSEEGDETLEEESEDPRAELIRRLLEYQKYKDAAQHLGSRAILGKDVFPRGSSSDIAHGPAPLMQVDMFQLLDAFQSVLERTQQTQEHQIDFERFSISEKIGELSERLQAGVKLPFIALFESQSGRAELIITFLALLEMTRLRMTRLFQEGPLEEIYVELCVGADDDSSDDDSFESSFDSFHASEDETHADG